MKKLRLLTSAMMLVVTASLAVAASLPDTEKRYHIVCSQFPDGCVTDGATASQQTPLYYLAKASNDEATYWIFSSEGDGFYTIRNAATKQYITYDGVRADIATEGELRRYVCMTDEAEGNSSLWYFGEQENGVFTIRNVQQEDHIWDVRTDSYCVGTYSNTGGGNINQLFMFFDEDGNQVKGEETKPEPIPVTSSGFDVTSWLAATEESTDGWAFEGDGWSDPNHGDYWNGEASVSTPFLERWHSSSEGPLSNGVLSQRLTQLPAGDYTLQADLIAVLQRSGGGWGWWGGQPEEVGHDVFLFANDQSVEVGTNDEAPQRYQVGFTVGDNGEATVGVRIQDTNANWVAIDNVKLFYSGTEANLVAYEKEIVKKELSDYYSLSEIDAMMAECGDSYEKLEALRLSIANLPKPDPLARGLLNLTIDGRALAYCESLGLYLHSLPEEHINQEYRATIDYEPREGCSNLSIGARVVKPGSQYLFGTIRPGNKYKFKVTLADGQKVEKDITFTSLPVVKITGTFDNNYSDGTITVYEPTAESAPDVLSMKAKWRGGITNSGGKHKRNYHVKLKDENGDKLEKKFFGLRNDNSWILESCQVDMSRIRNRVLTDLWNDYSTPPYYKDKEKKAMTGTRGEFVELMLNGEYRGIYCMTENMDRKQMQLKKIEEATETSDAVVHGQLWKSKDWSFATLMGSKPSGYRPYDYLSDPNEYSEMWDSYEVKYPDFEDYGYQTDWSTLYNAVNFVCYADDRDFREQVSDYFDMPIVIDYYILMETILSTDNHGKNMFFACYDKQASKKITFAVWDMDATCGQRWSDDYFHQSFLGPEQDYAQFVTRYEHGYYNLFQRLRDINPEDFNMKVRKRYRDLRQNHLATEAILKRFSTYLNRFKDCGAAQREYDRWSGDSDVAGHQLDFDDEMEYLTDWFTRRMNYLDTVEFDISSLPVGIVDLQDSKDNKSVFTVDGRRVKDNRSLTPGIYVKNGRKIVVK